MRGVSHVQGDGRGAGASVMFKVMCGVSAMFEVMGGGGGCVSHVQADGRGEGHQPCSM